MILARDIWYFALKLANHGSAWIPIFYRKRCRNVTFYLPSLNWSLKTRPSSISFDDSLTQERREAVPLEEHGHQVRICLQFCYFYSHFLHGIYLTLLCRTCFMLFMVAMMLCGAAYSRSSFRRNVEFDVAKSLHGISDNKHRMKRLDNTTKGRH